MVQRCARRKISYCLQIISPSCSTRWDQPRRRHILEICLLWGVAAAMPLPRSSRHFNPRLWICAQSLTVSTRISAWSFYVFIWTWTRYSPHFGHIESQLLNIFSTMQRTVHMIFRSGGLVVSMFIGWLVSNKK